MLKPTTYLSKKFIIPIPLFHDPISPSTMFLPYNKSRLTIGKPGLLVFADYEQLGQS